MFVADFNFENERELNKLQN